MINVATEPKVYLSKKKSGYYAKLRYTYLGKKYEKSYPLGKDKEQALVDYNKKRDLYDELSEELRKQKEEMMRVVYNMLCICLGTPPETFDWQIRDKKKKFKHK